MRTINYSIVLLIISCLLLVGCDTTVMETIQPGNMRFVFDLSDPAIVTGTIENSYNTVVKTLINRVSLPIGSYSLDWDGYGESGKEIVEGIYYFHIIIETSKGKSEYLSKFIFINP